MATRRALQRVGAGAGRPVEQLRTLLEPHRAYVAAGLAALDALPEARGIGFARRGEARARVEAVLGPALVSP